jgi:hypothetical protein
VHALSVDDGVEATTGGWPVTLSKTTITNGANSFNSTDQNQHGASLLLNNILYVPFGGHYGDGGSYLGWIIAIDITDPTKVASWASRSSRSGIWGSGGLASDGTYVVGVTGDTTSTARNMSDSEEVFRIKGMAEFTRDANSVFVPTESTAWDRPQGDLDFGASTPAYVPLAGGASLLVAPAKAGRVYVLDGTNLSNGKYPALGGELGNLTIGSTTAESVYTAPTVYSTPSGLHATMNVGVGPANCPGGSPGNASITSIALDPGKTPVAKISWCAAVAGGGHQNYMPISTTTDAAGTDAIVWYMNGSQLRGVDGETGAVLVTTKGTACDMVPSMGFPIAVKGRIVVAALGHLCSWSIDGK